MIKSEPDQPDSEASAPHPTTDQLKPVKLNTATCTTTSFTMHLLPREIGKVLLHNVGALAQKRLARGVRLNLTEATALIASVLQEMIRDGNHSVAQLMAIGE